MRVREEVLVKTSHQLFATCQTPREAACEATQPKEPASGHVLLQPWIAVSSLVQAAFD
jgi:hypothetical protein